MISRHPPYTLDGGGDPGELTLTADNSAPSAESDLNCDFDPNEHDQFGPQVISFKSRFSGSAAAAAAVVVNLRLYDAETGQFYDLAEFTQTGANGVSDSQGNVLILDCDPNCEGLHIQVTGLDTDQDFHCVVRRVK